MSVVAKDLKFLIVTPKWDEKNGGVVVLHKLCDLLNRAGRQAHLVPYIDNQLIQPGKSASGVWKVLRSRLYRWYRAFKTNPALQTPVFPGKPWLLDLSEYIVIYPELVLGNPLRAPHVVRWFLHKPGFHNQGNIVLGQGELYFFYNQAFGPFHMTGSRTSEHELRIIHYPLEHYNLEGALPEAERLGTAYCLRKGDKKPQIHHPADAILIDPLTHAETAAVFKRVKRFVSYDSITAYSFFAALCGCESVVVPDEGVSFEAWQSNPADAHGIAYGFSDAEIQRAKNTAHLCIERVHEMNRHNQTNLQVALMEMDSFFQTAGVKSSH